MDYFKILPHRFSQGRTRAVHTLKHVNCVIQFPEVSRDQVFYQEELASSHHKVYKCQMIMLRT